MFYNTSLVHREPMNTCADLGSFVRRGGVGGPGPTAQKNSLDNVFLVLGLFYSFHRWSNGFIAERTILSKESRGGANIFQGGPTFSRGGGGVQMLILSNYLPVHLNLREGRKVVFRYIPGAKGC